MVNNYRNTLKNLKTLFLLFALFTISSLVSSASLSSFKPSFDSIESTVVRKEVFFNYLLPVIHKKNAEIVALRNAISNNELNDNQLNDLAKKYRVETPSKEQLLKVIDILPPSLVLAQAANESDWGRSRFAKDFNNYFGIWCFTKGCGVIPKDRDEDATHEVASFNSLEDCIDYYVLNINRSYAYEDLRLMRKNQRESLQPITGTLLAQGLGNYAFPGDEYIESIQTLINFNQLERHDYLN
ncbi:glucosaminidase domain-containing protein [Pseudothioglobus sp. nBUS_23]|uniref:glucosaminidase domain-containing protein n=1 Tax=Pseudothioglobus sp. nBUS_23 TaxID=3395318 RepID=UPI003EBEC1AF